MAIQTHVSNFEYSNVNVKVYMHIYIYIFDFGQRKWNDLN
jgi:hypothetical protein